LIEATIDLTIGTGGTTVTLKIERGTAAAGTNVQTIGPLTAVAANRVQYTIIALDTPGQVVSQQYVCTVTVGAATGNSTCNYAALVLQVQTPT
jgi:hypothetical protein